MKETFVSSNHSSMKSPEMLLLSSFCESVMHRKTCGDESSEKPLQTVGSFSVLFSFVLPQRQEDARTLNPWGVRRTARVIPSFSAEPQMLKCCLKWPVCFLDPLQVEWMVTLRLLSFGQINRQSTEKCHHELLVCGIAVREVSPAHLIRPRR